MLQAIDQLMLAAKEGQLRQAVVRTKLEATRCKLAVLQQQLEMVRNEAQCDPLTSLANRAAFDRALVEAIARAQGQGAPLTLTLCSLDYFTRFVERFGAPAGVTCTASGPAVAPEAARAVTERLVLAEAASR